MRTSIVLMAFYVAMVATTLAPAAALAGDRHTYSGTVTIPVWIPADMLPSFTVDVDGETVGSSDVLPGGGTLTLAFAGSTTEPVIRTHDCPGRARGSRLRLSGAGGGTIITATYAPTGGVPVQAPSVRVPQEKSHVTAAVCAAAR